ncbi:MAG: MBL fold metallo-hydrolase [Thermoplasmata archaeon]|nr:MBL fold metallo-hydrolase [Thermoplasmata archaeon]
MGSGASVTVLDGHDCIGGTKILVSSGSSRVLMDFGTNYKRFQRYYEEFVRPRPGRGLVDLLALGILPRRRGFYRPDLLPTSEFPHGDAEFPGEPPSAVLLTHGHLDHCGAISSLDPKLPVYATATTLAMLRAWQETTLQDVSNEVTYYRLRAPHPGKSGVLTSVREEPHRRREFRIFDECPTPLRDLVQSPVGKRSGMDGPLPARASGPVSDGIHVRAMPVDHSVWGASAFFLEVDGAEIAYSGDLRFHGAHGKATESFLQQLEHRRPDILIVEGTRLRRTNDEPPGRPERSEDDVERHARATVQEYPGRFVVADFGPRNVERLATFRRVALAAGRELVLTAKDAYLLTCLSTADPTVPVDLRPGGMRIYEKPSAGAERLWQETVRRRYPDAYVDAEEIAANPGRWLVAFSFFDANELIDLRRGTRGGLWLYSSSEAHGEEQEFDFVRLQNWIDWAGMRAIGFSVDRATGTPEFTGEYHASGHAPEGDLLRLVERANPRIIIPVHTENPARYAEALPGFAARIAAVTDGTPIPVGGR